MDYTQYTESVQRGYEELGISGITCNEDCQEYYADQQCELCQRHYAGSFHDVTAYNLMDKGIIELTVCSDCVVYDAYGVYNAYGEVDL